MASAGEECAQKAAPSLEDAPENVASRARNLGLPGAQPRARDEATFVDGHIDERRFIAQPRARDEATFVDVAIAELAAEIARDPRSLALVEPALMDRLLAREGIADRVAPLPPTSEVEETNRTFSWCRRLAQNGRRPVLVLNDRSVQSLFGQLRERLCLELVPVRLIVVPEQLAAQEAAPAQPPARDSSVLAFLRLLPHTVILAPKDGWELRQMLRFAAGHGGPTAVYLPRGPLPAMHFPDFVDDIEFGRAEILEDGEEIALLTIGSLAAPAIEAAERLSEQGVSVGVVNARFVEPLDGETIRQIARTARGIITLEECAAHGGFGAAVLELLSAEGLATPVVIADAGGMPAADAAGDAPAALVQHIVRRALALTEHGAGPVPPAWAEGSVNGKAAGRKPAGGRAFGVFPAALRRERELVEQVALSPTVEAWVREYSSVGARKHYLWKWCRHGVDLTILPCVPAHLADHVSDTKLLSIILCVVFDDVADQHGNGRVLRTMLEITREGALPDLGGLSEREALVANVTWNLWRDYNARAQSYPYYDAFAELLGYDLTQFFNTMSYSQLLNRQLPLLNLAEHDLYTSHNMQMISFSTLDLMCSEVFRMDELGKLREAMWHAQCMGRIGNLLSTWQREISDRDFTSGVFARAVAQGDLTIEQLLSGDAGEIEAAILEGEHERYFYRRWLHHRERLRSRARQIRSIDLTPTLDGHDRFFLMHLGSRGLI